MRFFSHKLGHFCSSILNTINNEIQANERMMGIEPTQPAWKASTLPLSHIRTWRRQDSNLRTLSRVDLQSTAINHSTTPPIYSQVLYFLTNYI
ncbi:hypothetical protein CAXC1_120073 [Candidatus Xenohaliotis californiensis]|uniref:Uncharacterized protein n=1 Tax=Candidatus Xenohaliotis californiensis TaxID=84677 RepID=A0ABP0ERQ2_9RICK|nr:hypothetical protein CAXC1_120073 [Candidatus Xenohaliotis californiensis]